MALVMPPRVLKDLGIRVGQRLSLNVTPDGSMVLKPKHRFNLSDMIAQWDLSAPPPSDLEIWDSTRPEGQERL